MEEEEELKGGERAGHPTLPSLQVYTVRGEGE